MLSLINRFTSLKTNYANLETWISVGGWSFSDPGSTQTAWSNMASTSSNRASFISQLLQFVQTYGFDGVDLDWEYPGTHCIHRPPCSLTMSQRLTPGTNRSIRSWWVIGGCSQLRLARQGDEKRVRDQDRNLCHHPNILLVPAGFPARQDGNLRRLVQPDGIRPPWHMGCVRYLYR